MGRVTVGIVSNNKRFRIAYRLLIEAEANGYVYILWDALAGEDVRTCLNYYGRPDVVLVDYEGICNQTRLDLKELKGLFPESGFLLICDDCKKSRRGKIGKELRQLLVSKYCSAQKLLSSISKAVLYTVVSKKQPSIGFS